MIHLADPPAASAIKVEQIAEGVRLKWRPRPQRRAFLWASVEVVFACGTLWLTVDGAIKVGRRARSERLWPLVELASGVGLQALAVPVAARKYSLATEVLSLKTDSLVHFPALSPAKVERAAWERGGGKIRARWRTLRAYLGKRASRLVERDAVTEIRLMGRGWYEHVVVDAQAGRVDIGRYMRRADRGWLLSVLRRWRDTGKEGAA